jgi:alpha-beta hydrolase superfamily lysophospholipase
VLGRWPALEAMLAAEEIPDAPIDPATLSRNPEVGRAYVDDPLVWHGPFKRPTVEALQRCLDAVTGAGTVGDVPVLWLHGEDDQLVPLPGSREGWATFAGPRSTSKVYPGARHEIFNETNRDDVLDDVVDFVRGVLPDRG